jgi:hypothetical protein
MSQFTFLDINSNFTNAVTNHNVNHYDGCGLQKRIPNYSFSLQMDTTAPEMKANCSYFWRRGSYLYLRKHYPCHTFGRGGHISFKTVVAYLEKVKVKVYVMIHINRAKYENFISNTNPKTFMN